mmetsp:Transcript_18775/g.43942  ORF Transcript_18775/g.43942 Transcript_18775/m.43942 type:complete len:204 (-) Transcript_18775:1273-1884(-)
MRSWSRSGKWECSNAVGLVVAAGVVTAEDHLEVPRMHDWMGVWAAVVVTIVAVLAHLSLIDSVAVTVVAATVVTVVVVWPLASGNLCPGVTTIATTGAEVVVTVTTTSGPAGVAVVRALIWAVAVAIAVHRMSAVMATVVWATGMMLCLGLRAVATHLPVTVVTVVTVVDEVDEVLVTSDHSATREGCCCRWRTWCGVTTRGA